MGATISTAVVFAGAGPGGTGPLVCAAQRGELRRLLDAGIAILDRRPRIGCGSLDRYDLNADSAGTSFLECTDKTKLRRELGLEELSIATRRLEAYRDGHPPLVRVAAHLRSVGASLQRTVERHARSRFFGSTIVRELRCMPDGTLRIETASENGRERVFRSRYAVLALGGRQRFDDLADRELDGVRRVADLDRRRVVLSDSLMTTHGLEAVQRGLQRAKRPSVVVLGGSHSAFSVAWTLLERTRGVDWHTGSIRILYRSEPRVFYPDASGALADGYTFTSADVCPRTGRVHRLGGLRGDGRQLWRRISGRAQPAEVRVRVEPLASVDLPSLLLDATWIVPALGYRPRTVPVYDARGERLVLAAERGGEHVDDRCRVRLADGRSLPQLFGIGMACGFRPSGELGGEPSFRGQTNGVWLYQNGIGARVLDGLRDLHERVA